MAARPRRPVAHRWRTVAAALTSVAVSGCDLPGFGAPDAASREGESVRSLWSGFFVAAVLVALLVYVLLAFVLLRYRRRGASDDAVPGQHAYNIPLEVAYTVAPVLIVAVLFFFSVRAEHRVTAVSERPVARVEVVAFQWGWQFRYLGEGFTVDAEAGEPPELVLPVDAPSNLRLVAEDVAHSFWVPDFLSKRDLIPGVRNEITVTPNRPGSYVGRCAEFCGLDHWRMYFSVRVVPRADYDAWVAERGGSGS